MKRILLLSGSARRESLNTRLIEETSRRLAGRAEVDIPAALEIQLPLYNPDEETDLNILESVKALNSRFSDAHGFIFACPEYNASISPFLKNTIDWISRAAWLWPDAANPFYRRPVLLMSASGGWAGGTTALSHVRQIFVYLGANVLAQQVHFPQAETYWNGTTFDIEASHGLYLESALEYFLTLSESAT